MLSFDNLINKFKSQRDFSEMKLIKDSLMNKKFTYQKSSKALFVIFPYWGGKIRNNFFLRKFLIKKGFSILELEFPEEILSSNTDLTLEYFETIQKITTQEILKLKNKYNFKEIKVTGISLGCINALMYSNKNELVNEITLILPGHCLAESVWTGVATRKIKENCKIKNIYLNKLKRKWSRLAPENNSDKLFTKRITIFLSKSDKIISYNHGKKLLNKLKNSGYNISHKNDSTIGHYLTILKFHLFPQKFIIITL